MKQTLLVLVLSGLVGTLAMAQQTPTASPARPLTPAEQRQKEKIEREVARTRQIRAELAQKQREYEAKQAEKERQRQARKAGKEQELQNREAAKSNPAAAPTAPSTTAPAVSTPAPAVAEPSRREKRRKEPVATPTPVADSQAVQTTAPAPVAPAKPERKARATRSVNRPADSAATSAAVTQPNAVRPGREFLPKGHLFEPILLDPLESQSYGSVLPLYYTDGKKYQGSIVPFAFGFAKPFYRRTTEPGRSEEWVLDVASFTQFEVYYDEVKGRQRRQIMNTDYKVSILYNIRRGDNNYRFRVYHLSSHLGDDYLFRNRITAPSPNSVNYEVVDATYSRMARDWRLYGGLGIGLRKSEERKRFNAQLGAYYRKSSDRAARLVGGVDIKFWQQTDFRPGIHGGIGVELGRTANNLTFLAETYSGFRPYSQYEDQQIFWLGIGMYLNPF